MSRRSASGGGKRIGAGRLRVDAGRAVAKLREYQLPDPTAWVLEVVRAAVAKGAKRVRVFGDADDLWIGWEGPPPEEAHLKELLHELVSPAPEEARRWLRLMAIGVCDAASAMAWGLELRSGRLFRCAQGGKTNPGN